VSKGRQYRTGDGGVELIRAKKKEKGKRRAKKNPEKENRKNK